jgi:hypothetical protein
MAKYALQEENDERNATMVLEHMSRLKESTKRKSVCKRRKHKEAIHYKQSFQDCSRIDSYRHQE